jgi:hypothetical protein
MEATSIHIGIFLMRSSGLLGYVETSSGTPN